MRKLGITLLAISMVLMTACSGGKQATDTNTTKTPATESTPKGALKLTGDVDTSKTLTTLISIEPPPAFHGSVLDDTAGTNWSIQPFLFEALADYSPLPTKEFKPAGLESYKLDGNKLTMVLRSGMKWSDGSAITTDDVMTGFYLAARSGTFWQVVSKLEKTDDKTINIEFVNNSPLNLSLVLNGYIMTPKKVYGDLADGYKTYVEKYRVFDKATQRYKFDAAGDATSKDLKAKVDAFKPDPLKQLFSGPYILTAVTTSEAMFEANPNYRMQPKIKKIRGLRAAGKEAYTAAVLQNDYTIENGGLSPEMTTQVNKKFADTLRTTFVPEFSQMGYMFNITKYPVSIPEVRKALAYMMDRETLIKTAEPGSFISDSHASGMLPSLIPTYTDKGFVDTLTDYKYDPAKAEKLLTGIGWKKVNGKWANEKGEPVKFELATISSWPSLMYPGEAYATMLKEAGFDVDFKPMEAAAFVAYMKAGSTMIADYFVPSASTYAHPYEIYNGIFAATYGTYMGLPALQPSQDRVLKAPTAGKEYNVSQMLIQAYSATDPAQLKKITQDLMTLENDLVLFVPLIEKTAPLRIYDPKLSVAQGEIGKPQNSFYFYGNLNNMLAKMIRGGELYFVK